MIFCSRQQLDNPLMVRWAYYGGLALDVQQCGKDL
jgi:hypothetical protein